MKKIIALIIAVTIIITALNISTYATSEPSAMTPQEYKLSQSHLIDEYCNGDITFLEWQEQQAALNTEFLEANKKLGDTAYAVAVTTSNQFSGISQKISSAFSQWGDDSRQRVADWWNGVTSDVPTETVQTPTTDYMGYGALCTSIVNSNYSYATACDYILVEFSEDGNTAYLTFYNKDGSLTDNIHMENGSSTISEGLRSGTRISVPYVDGEFIESNGNHIKLSGDVRYIDGTQFPTGEEFEIVTTKKFDEMPAPDLDDLLNDFAEELERQMPDLSTIEGLLKAIYARMGKLDSDNDNALLSAINASILKLVNADKDKPDSEGNTNEELVNTLLEIRDMIKEGDFGTSPEAHGHEISGTLYNVKPLDKNWFNKLFHDKENLKVEYEGTTYYLEDCGCLKLGDKYYSVNMNYDAVSLIDFDFNSDDDFEIDVKFADDKKYSEIRDNLGTLKDLLPQNQNPRDGISAFSLSGEKSFLNGVLSTSQNTKINTVMGYIEDYIAMGVPYESIQENLSTYEAIIFDNNYTPKDLTFTVFDTKFTLLSYEALTSSDDTWEDTSEYTSSLDIVKAFTSILISFWWVLSMYKKLSNLI